MKIGIFTFHCAINYGAVLQAYGLQTYLESLGHDVYIIDYRPDYLIEPYRVFRYEYRSNTSFMANVKNLCREFLVAPIRFFRKLKFHRFIDQYLNLYSWNLDLNAFDVFVFGSDQIWNPLITNGLDKIYFGDFPSALNKKLVSYAASVGSLSYLNHQDTLYLKSRLLSFNTITVRENRLADFLNNECGIFAKVVSDPVLLAGRAVFDKLAIDIKEKSSYLLLFTLDRDESTIKPAYEIASKKKMKVVEVISSNESLYNKNIKQTLSPCEFLGYLKYASFVVTSSFHGTALSILFEKEFKAVVSNVKKGERIISLLEDKGLLENIIFV